jgi:DeoR family ulaG and ulaABCDEF operon transcriptional repressor
MLEEERHQEILRLLNQDYVVSVQALCRMLRSSQTTIRRDLGELAGRGLITRVRGGARQNQAPSAENLRKYVPPFSAPQIVEIPFAYRREVMAEQKRLIAEKAVSLCGKEDVIMMDGSSTVYHMVYFLKNHTMRICTHSFAVAEYLMKNTNCLVILSGGVVYKDSQLIYDPFETNIFRNYSISKVFMSGKGIDERGVTNSDIMLIKIDQAMINSGKELIILIDSSKFGKASELLLCDYSRISTIITDSGVQDKHREMVLSKGVNLIIAGGR